MSTGISMSSVNKIKELADNGDYSLALDILEHQDLSKSLSPQFIRICGEVYYENGRYSEARGALVRAHSMAPAGNKIIYSLIKLYLAMGFRDLAEHYFDIYRFNQDKKDAGTYRIEYMIAKAYHKPVNELYSILVSANDIETSEEWDYEMLLLHAYIRNTGKFDSAAVEFRAKYRNSARLSTLDELLRSDCDLESMIYVFPCEEKTDDAPDQEIIREQEKKILAEDNLKIHPKDAKIMIMVEDDAPVTSSMKLKQMWIRSKDKKEHKKELKREESEEDKKDKKKSRTFFGIMSKKEEELVDKEMQDIQSEDFDKEKLLDEVVSGGENSEETAAAEMAASSDGKITDTVAKKKGEDVGAETTVEPVSEGEDKAIDAVQDMTELSPENLSAEDSAVYNTEEEDSFVIEEEPEEVVMVDADLVNTVVTESDAEESDKAGEYDPDVQEESFDPEFDKEDEDTFFAAEDEEHAADQDTEDAFDFDKAFESLEEFDVEEDDFDIEDVTADNLEDVFNPEESLESEVTKESDEESEHTEDVQIDDDEPEHTEDIQIDDNEPEHIEDIQIDDEPEHIDGVQISDDEHDQVENVDNEVISEPESSDTEEEIEPCITAEEEFETFDDADNFKSAENFEIIEDFVSEDDFDHLEDVGEIEDVEDIDISSFDDDENVEIKDIDIESADLESEDITENVNFKDVNSEDENVSSKDKYLDFPVFKSSLFPDYNTEGAKMYAVGESKTPHIEAEEAKISENLQKEEDLLGETDRLLARLGIKFETEFKSILNFDEDGSGDISSDDNPEENSSDDELVKKESANEENIPEQVDSGIADGERPINEKMEKDKKRDKKSFKLKGK